MITYSKVREGEDGMNTTTKAMLGAFAGIAISTIGGAISLHSKKPTDEFSGSTSANLAQTRCRNSA